MTAYRFLAETLRAPTLLGEVPLSNPTFGRKRNGVGEMSATVPLPPDDAMASALIAMTGRYRVLHVERDGLIVWSGIVWARNYHRSTRALGVRCAEIPSWLRRVIIRDTLTFAAEDQATIVGDLLDHAQVQLGGDLGITHTLAATGRVRDRTYLRSDLKPVGEAIEQLAAVIDGFDWSLDTYWSGEQIVREFRLHYPRIGRRSATSQLTVDLDAPGVEVAEWSEDATKATTRHTAVGAGDGAAQLTAMATDVEALVAGDPILDSTESLKDVSDPATLQGHAEQGLVDRAPSVGPPSVVLAADHAPVFGSYVAGDDLRVRLQPGVDPFWPDGLDTTQRIEAWSLTVPDGGPELVTLTLGHVP